ncbi:hypothetical protein BC833DRAFT_594721 [Globomyces pollinis-pini]|nr:hypothetical protein BC833DRAFT_594721 [Globomyces pollinis-pini]
MIISKTSVKNEQAVSFLQMNDIDLIVEDDDEMQEFQSSPPIQNFATFPEIQPQTNSPVSSPVSSRNGTSTTLHESDSEMKTEVPTTTPLILQDLTEISKTALVVTDSIDSDNEREDSIGFVPDLRIELTGFEELDYTRQSYENDSHYGVLSNLNVSGWWSTLKYMFCLGK